MKWNKDSWRSLPIKQQPIYSNLDELKNTEIRLATLPPLVFAGEVRSLKKELASASLGKSFLLQGGDCAESFANYRADNIKNMFKVILQMSAVLTFAGSFPIVKVGRIAGQFAKPRSSDFEEINGVKLPSYRGDIVNDLEFTQEAREPKPEKLIQAYYQSATTLNLLRAFARGGLANLHEIHRWNLGFAKAAEIETKFSNLVNEITRALDFMEACGINPETQAINETRFYTSHEALLLPYEEALTRIDSTSGDWYDCSAHMLWIGERTRGLNEAHVNFLSGVKNPVGVKIGPTATPDEILGLCEKLNPENEAGRLNLIVRMGADKIDSNLPRLLRAVKSEGKMVLWSSDPMHGNTFKTTNNYKTRAFDKILKEVKSFFEIHKSEGTYPGGIHLEMSGDDVTECTGGFFNVKEETLAKRYETQCDPRLNANQSLELAFLVADLLKEFKK
ncbi:class II 3-deoxy-7-phosphoheptulonate synthase [Campylobacter ureolyticus]|uniref:Phospho-2-dehydro-3-deoxyheptonate aldolase n=1 Tax=Campylobacter ureolyticus TaxID=827 RepID=A0A9Q4PWC2_9BACT|nr:3-deoxy-7-phosphoheptulonate synthase class II [Campylobacter ureolyticus]MCZ6160360.1 3-deoxy-7-phosphoheptulonate synthase class II [Campylobacter ureolyticus]MCZ6163360.1 3-deoxy-7-phosphoheptulonate synthase class II [Campylobacter ureolyticus]MCZ6165212.1 3-deoxy-7-phosphoheptulonate synthase class II [Campylobacter ureolyticus]MCZ6167201.1 3-deoxy-7-phosphoheptulonate synthase class II [Campylobacter ureolyticus]MDU5326235.1 3-deoxy-7-phosphoheptulonate synthase class II [Campylobacte